MDLGGKIRKCYDDIYILLRKTNMKKFAFKSREPYVKADVLTKEQKKSIKDYYAKYGKVTDYFHNFYTQKNGMFDEKYIPDDIYYTKINLFYNDHKSAKVMDNKSYYDTMFPNIPQAVIIATRKGNFWFIGHDRVTCDDVLDMVCNEDSVCIKKATDSSGGAGVYLIEKSECENYRQAVQNVFSKISGDIVIQKRIIQHKTMSELNSTSVNTIRILTLLRENDVKICSAIVRIGKPDAKLDNFTSGGMAVGVTPSGQLKKYAYFSSGERIEKNLSTGLPFEGFQLPSFDETIALVKKAHMYVPSFRLVSWDIAIREDGTPILIEANLSDGGLGSHQLNNGPLFGDDTREILDEVFGK